MGTAVALGAGAGLVDRLKTSSFTDDARVHLWKDALRILAAHPAGIGRGAFDHVYPIYRTVQTWSPITFAFLENHPLQLLVDSGWLLFAAILAGVALVVREVVRRGRRDRIEAALLAGLFAVIAHSFLDFALETLGLALPFAAVLGTVLGGCHPEKAEPPSKRAVWALVAVTCASLVFSAASIAHPSDDDFDKLLKRAHEPPGGAGHPAPRPGHPSDGLLLRRSLTHRPSRSRSPGAPLHACTRSIGRSGSVPAATRSTRRSRARCGRWASGARRWASGARPCRAGPSFFTKAMTELWQSGAKPSELAGLASIDPARMVETADFLANNNRLADALSVLDEADLLGASRAESLLTRCRLQIQLGQLAAATTTLAEARAAGIQDPRLAVLEANLILGNKGAAGANEAFAILDLAATRYPLDVPVQRLRIQLVSTYAKWQAADRAIDGFKLALYQATGRAVEANQMAARIRAQLSQWNAAFSEYRTALAQTPADVNIWVELAETAERSGRDSTAREAYAEASRLLPSDARITASLRRVEARQGYLRGAPTPAPPGLLDR